MKNDLVQKLLEIAEKISRGEILEYQYYGFYMVGAFDSLIRNLKSYEAFELLEKLCEKYNEFKSGNDNLKGFFILLSYLVRISETTELPKGMQHILSENKNELADLYSWYRL